MIGKQEKLIFEYPYEKDVDGLFTPMSVIELIDLDLGDGSNQKTKAYKGIVDTGSKITLISQEIVKSFNFTMLGTSHQINTAVSSDTVMVAPYYVRLRFKHHQYDNNSTQDIKCYCCERKFLRQDILLGMDFLNYFEITFSGTEKKIIIVETEEK